MKATTKLCMIIGDPVAHSFSPKLHNAGYEALGIDHEFLYVARRVKTEQLAAFIQEARETEIRGVSCTIPHKIAVMKHLDRIDKVAKKIGAVNTVVNEQGLLKGYNTDWLGVVIPLEKITPLKNQRVALLGAGGAARAVAYGISQRGGKITVYNRTRKKAVELAREFGCQVGSLAKINEIKKMDIIINATSIGLPPRQDQTPLPKQLISPHQIVFDSIYVPYETRLLKEAKAQGAKIIHGMEMFLHQGMAQFRLYTGRPAPEQAMRAALKTLYV